MLFSLILSFVSASVRAAIRFPRRLVMGGGALHAAVRRFLDLVEILFEYLVWLAQWGSWLLDWIFRLPLTLPQLLGWTYPVTLRLSVQILTDETGEPSVPVATVQAWLREAAAVLRSCDVSLSVEAITLVPGERYLSSTRCSPYCLLRRFFTWFSSRVRGIGPGITVYVVRAIHGASGCSYPGSSWVLIGANADGTVIVHEIGHLCDLWRHSSDPDNVMTIRGGGTHDRITRGQAILIRTSRFMLPP
jgi:hypothetical protein